VNARREPLAQAGDAGSRVRIGNGQESCLIGDGPKSCLIWGVGFGDGLEDLLDLDGIGSLGEGFSFILREIGWLTLLNSVD
jgi:hypothetical protein